MPGALHWGVPSPWWDLGVGAEWVPPPSWALLPVTAAATVTAAAAAAPCSEGEAGQERAVPDGWQDGPGTKEEEEDDGDARPS